MIEVLQWNKKNVKAISDEWQDEKGVVNNRETLKYLDKHLNKPITVNNLWISR